MSFALVANESLRSLLCGASLFLALYLLFTPKDTNLNEHRDATVKRENQETTLDILAGAIARTRTA